jgi:hypothetical protein
VKKVFGVGNAIRSEEDTAYIAKEVGNLEFLGFLPHSERLAAYEREGRSPFEIPELRDEASALVGKITEAD